MYRNEGIIYKYRRRPDDGSFENPDDGSLENMLYKPRKCCYNNIVTNVTKLLNVEEQ